tara:strand:- start:154 stop:849 length:696 start_codon:yes stop_codon:yes gene_type:complete
MNQSEILYCSTCSKEFKRKTCFDKHISICGVLNNKDKDFIPSQREIYMLFIDLNKKYEQLDKKYNQLQSKYNNLCIKNKITPIDYLNLNIKPNCKFIDSINTINILRKDIDFILKNSFIDTVCLILSNSILKNNIDNIQCFEEKKDCIFIFDEKWKLLCKEYLEKIVHEIRQKLFIEFKCFIDENKKKLYDDDFSIIYTETMKKLMDENINENVKIKNSIYKNFKNKLTIC